MRPGRMILEHPIASQLAVIASNHEQEIDDAIAGHGHFVPYVWVDEENRANLSLHILIFDPKLRRYQTVSSHYYVDNRSGAVWCYESTRSHLGVRYDNRRHPRTLAQLDSALSNYVTKLQFLRASEPVEGEAAE